MVATFGGGYKATRMPAGMRVSPPEVCRVVVEDQSNRAAGGVPGVQIFQQVDELAVTVQIPMVVDFRGGGGWARAGAGDGNEPQSVNS